MKAQEIINAAGRFLLAIDSGGSLNTDELADGLTALQQMVDSWSAQAVPIWTISSDAFALTGALNYVVGATGPMPQRWVKPKSAVIYAGNVLRIPVKIATAEEWAAGIGSATMPAMYWDGGFPSGFLYINPAIAGATIEIFSYKPLVSPVGLDQELVLPPGYERAFYMNLAIDFAPQLGREPTPTMLQLAQDAKTSIFGLNAATLGPPSAAGAPTPA